MTKYIFLCGLIFFTSLCFSQFRIDADFAITPTSFSPDTSVIRNTNTNYRGDDPFHIFRAEIFGRYAMSEMFDVNANALYDINAGNFSRIQKKEFRLCGLFVTGHFDSVFNLRYGKIPTPIGSFPSRRFAYDNTLIGEPLMYSYKTPLGGNFALNDSALFFNRNNFIQGVAPIYEAYWNEGFSAFGSMSGIRWDVAVTKNSLSFPKTKRSYGNQIAGRIGTNGEDINVGISAGVGSYLQSGKNLFNSTKVENVKQNLIGADAHYTYWRYEFLGEILLSTWDAPLTTEKKLKTTSFFGEGRYQIKGNIWLTARAEQLTYNLIDSSGTKTKWGYDVQRLEAGIRYTFSSTLIKGVWQHTILSTKPTETLLDIYAVQIVFRWEDIFKSGQ